MIHVCFGLHDKTGRYSKFTGTAMLSMFENHNTPPRLPSITVHILHDNTLSTDNRDKFIYLAGQYGQRVKFYNVEELCKDSINEISNLVPSLKEAWFSIAGIYRFFIPQLLPNDINKIIYLDSDIIVNLDIRELWQINLNNKILGIIPELPNGENSKEKFNLCRDRLVKPEDYFNSGVLLVNLARFRNEEKTIVDGIRFAVKNPQYSFFFDQDILNYCFADKSLHLSPKFNRFIRWARWQNEKVIGEKIYHYTGTWQEVSFSLDMRDPFNRLWMKYFVQTPWFSEETIGRLYSGFQQIHVGLKQSMVTLSAIMSGKTRGFFAPPTNIDGLKKFFSIRDDEEIILAENQDSIKKLLDAMNVSRGKKVFFIMIPFPFQILIQAGFAPGKDFLNGLEFFSEAQGVPLNSYPLVQAM